MSAHSSTLQNPAIQTFPKIIQGGMGVAVSGWRLAQAVSRTGQLGVVSGTALDQVFARRLQDGDPGGHMRRGLDHFPFPEIADRIWRQFYIPGGKRSTEAYQTPVKPTKDSPRELQELYVAANFVEVFLARMGHPNPVGINYLEKIQIPHLPSIYGAMLAGVDYVLMGAGIPLKIPGVLDRFARQDAASYALHVVGAQEGDDSTLTFNPREFFAEELGSAELPAITRPKFLAIVSSNTLATTLIRKADGAVDGFIIEGNTAGGHNAPPRGKAQFDETGEVIYGERDRVDLEKLRELGVPFWLAGGYGSPEKLAEALAQGAAGIQAGTAFALCEESGFREDYKAALIEKVLSGAAKVSTDMLASPTSFPFKVVSVEGTSSEPEVYASRPRICDLGFLREAYRMEDGSIGYRCAGEPVSTYTANGGKIENTIGRKCLCNALLANIGHAQVRCGKHVEPGLLTAGNDLPGVARFIPVGANSYQAADVIATLLSRVGELAAV